MFATLILIAVSLFPAGQEPGQAEPDFNLEIKPILSERCFLCHGPDESSRESGLRLDVREEATNDSIVPGDAENSEVYSRLIETDEDMRMPPVEHGSGLSDEEIDLIKRWIDAGAKYDKHWSYVPPKRIQKSKAHNGWGNSRIDDFVYQKMREHGLNPSPAADRVSIIRRLALDLTGLPPTLEETDRLYKRGTEKEYEEMVDYFLGKPAFGERWAAMWLDHARYADSMGYAEDRTRTIWEFRDYVVRAFNKNKPFDQFTIEQLAGDLLENPSKEQLIATAFHRNTTTNTEGGTIDEEFRSAAVVDRTNTTMAVWMGTTMACAQCHTHKYDPITHEEYFQLYSFFNSTADNDQLDDSPVLKLFTDEQRERISGFESAVAELREDIADWDSQLEYRKEGYLNEKMLAWQTNVRNRESNIVTGRIVRLELPKTNAILSLAEVEVFAAGKNVALSGTATQSSTAFGGPPELAHDGVTDGEFNRSQSVTHTANEDSPWWELELDQDYELEKIVVWNRTENLHSRLDSVKISILDSQRKLIWKDSIEKAEPEPREFKISYLPENVFAIARQNKAKPGEAKELKDYFVQHFDPNISRHNEIKELERQIEFITPRTTVPVMKELDEPRDTFIHLRGSYMNLGKKVERATPSVFHPLQSEARGRLSLAKWIVSKDNPLTARVTVNRFWQQLFGIGIVATGEEFGSQGEYPTHPKLLDYLACEFMDSGWDIKSLLKQMVMSTTYRQSSTTTKEKIESDPNNRWLSRGPRFRLSAEMIRDQALACSGLLSPKMCGPPVQPPQPKSGLKFAFGGEGADWEDSVGEDRYRRAIYTRWRRSSPYPSLTTFDVANREVCELSRLRTNTPLQALVTLNDPVFVEAAQSLARNIYSSKQSNEEIATLAFRRCLGRLPKENELALLTKLFEDAKEHFESDPSAAKTFANDPLNPMPEKDTDWIAYAAWTTVANTILNLDEMFLKR